MAILAGLGLCAGFLGGLLGIGGGALIVPGLVFFLNFDQHRAHGTSLAAALLLSAVGVATYSLHGNIDLLLAIGIAAGGIVGAIFGAKAANAIKAKALRRVFGVFLIIVGVRMILTALGTGPAAPAEPVIERDVLYQVFVTFGIGVLTGFASGLLGVGGGIVMVPAMTLLLGVPQQVAQGVSLAAIIPTAFTGILIHNKAGNVDLKVAQWLGIGGAVGAFGGATLAATLASPTLKSVFGVFLIIMAVLTVLKKRNGRHGSEVR